MQLATVQRTIEQNKKNYWVVSASLYIKISDGSVQLEHDCIADLIAEMGDTPSPDMGLPKPRAEYLLNGSFYPSSQQAVAAGQVRVKFAGKSKTLNVFGDRYWNLGIPSQPDSILSLPLNYQNAFGGEEALSNPIGKGFKQDQLPNIEYADAVISSNSANYPPACFAPMDTTWSSRSQYQGTYDQTYIEQHFPGFPPDTDWRFFMTAAEDQWFDGFLKGDEAFQLFNVHPERSLIIGELPGFYPRCFALDTQEVHQEQQFKEVNLNLDTAWFFPEHDTVQLIWRGGLEVLDDDASQISHLLMAYEHLNDHRRSIDDYRQSMTTRIENKNPLTDSLSTQDLIPESEKSAMQLLMESAFNVKTESAFEDNLKAKAESINDYVDSQMKTAVKDVKSQVDSPLVDAADKDKISKLLDGSTASGGESDTQQLVDKLNQILPGIADGNAQKIDLSDFSFDKIDDILDEIEAFTSVKKNDAIESVQPKIAELKAILDTTEASQISTDQINAIHEQVAVLEKLDDAPAAVALPRLDIDSIVAQLSGISPEVQKAKQELHLLSTNPVMANSPALQAAKENLARLEGGELDKLSDQLSDARSQFMTGYAMSAHHSPYGLSPHKDETKAKALLERILRTDRNASELDFACLDLSKMNLDGVDFSFCLMEQVNLTGASLIGANFHGAVLARANLTSANFTGANLTDCNLGGSVCHETIFDQATLLRTKLSKSDLKFAEFKQANIDQPEVLDMTLEGVNFEGASINSWPFLEMSISDVTFTKATLKSCSFINCRLNACDFIRADLPSTTWANCNLSNIDFTQSNMEKNCFVFEEDKPCEMRDLIFKGAKVMTSNLQKMTFNRADFSGADISHANFTGSSLQEAKLDRCMAYRTQFQKADLTNASLFQSNLMESILRKATLQDVNFQESNLYSADFIRSVIQGSQFQGANLDATIIKDWRPA